MTKHYHILLISPAPDAARAVLESSDLLHDLTTAPDAAAGMRTASRVAFDCILLEHELPDRRGLSVLADLRAAGVLTPVILLSSAGDEQLAVDAFKAGASDYIPAATMSPAHLALAVRSAVRLRRAERLAHSADNRLRESESRFRTMADHAPVMLWTSDATGRMDYFNKVWLEFRGRTADQELGDGWVDGLHPDDRAAIVAAHHAAHQTHRPFTTECRLLRHDGQHRWVLASATPRLLPNGAFAGFTGSAIDITERKQLEQLRLALLENERLAREQAEAARARLTFLADASRVLSESLDYRTTLASVARLAVPTVADWCTVDVVDPDEPAAAAREGGAATTLTLKRLAVAHADPQKVSLAHDLHRRFPPDPEAPSGIYNVLRTGRPELYGDIPEELLAQTVRDPEQLAIIRTLQLRSAIMVPLSARGRVLGVLSLVSSRQDRRYVEADLDFALDLARRAATAIDNSLLHRDLQKAKESAENASHAKDQFLAVLSHELRTPLSPVLLTASALENETDLDRIREGLEVIRRNVELEARLIDDLLDLTRIARGKLPLNPEVLDAHTVIHNTMEIVRPDLAAKNIRLDLDLRAGQPQLLADPARLQQILWNLLKNAAKFTPEGGRVEVRTYNEAGAIVMEVQDTGIGIPADVLPRIFDAFEQGERTITRQFGGLGLGLAISKALAHRHAGELTAHSEGKDRGAKFRLRLHTSPVPTPSLWGPSPPTSPPSSPSAPPVPPPGVGGVSNGVRVLLVDDHEDTARSMQRLLTRLGYQVETAGSVKEAVAVGARARFDLLISDIGLPDGSGLEIPGKLREAGRAEGMRAVALSGFGTEADVRRSREAGFDEHLTKPVNIHALQELIGRLVGGRKSGGTDGGAPAVAAGVERSIR